MKRYIVRWEIPWVNHGIELISADSAKEAQDICRQMHDPYKTQLHFRAKATTVKQDRRKRWAKPR